MTYDGPLVAVIITVWVYWSCVLALIIRSNVGYGTPAGGLPRTRRERWMWLGWVPLVVLWHLLPILAGLDLHPWMNIPETLLQSRAVSAVRTAAAVCGVSALLLTLPCWRGMGRNWSIAVVPSKRTNLITEGMFARIRHPIYALNMVLMLATVVVVPTVLMLVIGLIHVCLIHTKTVGEETYLHRTHGRQYADYCRRTGRYLPRIATARPSQPVYKRAA